jgi:hypothetical protein
MTNEPNYVIYDQWLSKDTQATLAQTFQDLRTSAETTTRLIWDDQPGNSLSWLGMNLIRAWQTQFQAPCLVPRVWVEQLRADLKVDAHSDPLALYLLTEQDIEVKFDGQRIPMTQGQFMVIDQGLDIDIEGQGLVMLFLLVPPGEGRQFATPPRGFSSAPKP